MFRVAFKLCNSVPGSCQDVDLLELVDDLQDQSNPSNPFADAISCQSFNISFVSDMEGVEIFYEVE